MSGILRWLLQVLTVPLRALLSAPARILSGSRRLAGLSLPFQVAILTFLILLVAVIVTVVAFCYKASIFPEAKLTVEFWVKVLVPVFLAPLVLYKALSLWLEGPKSPYPDIDNAWKAGLSELQRKKLNLRQTPLFLVIGSTSEQQERAIFQAAGREYFVTGAPEGNASLHWYAHADAVYVVASQTCCLSGLGRNKIPGADMPPGPAAHGGTVQPQPDLRQTIAVGGGSAPARPDPLAATAVIRPQAPPPQSPQPSDGFRGTIVGPAAARGTTPQPGASAPDRNIQTDKRFFEEQRKRFGWLCRLIRNSRLPYAPINGVLAMLPFSYVQSNMSGVRKLLSDSLRYDLEEVLASLMIRCPVTVLVTDLDEEAGFREFIRRMVRRQGQEWVKERRFGSSFPLEITVTPDRAQKLSALLGSAFEGWIYDFFHDEESILRSAGNTSLYAFLGKVRQSVRNLGTVFGSFASLHPKAGGATSSAEVIFFSGCYFAGTGKTDERQVFVKSILSTKLIDEQEELEWTAAALREDGRDQWLGLLVSAIDTVLLIAFVTVGIVWMYSKP